MEWKVGKSYHARTGELMTMETMGRKKFCMRMRNPKTAKYTKFRLEGLIVNLDGWAKEAGVKEVDLKTFKPTGLVGE